MKKTGWFVALFVAVALLVPGMALAEGKVQWVPAAKAAKMAKEAGKKQYIFFYTDWCGYCTRMLGQTLADDAVARYLNENFVSVRINPEKDKNDIRADITPRGYPTNAFVDPANKLILAMPGYSPPEHFLMLLKWVKTGANETMNFKDFMNQEQAKGAAPGKEQAAKAPWEKPVTKAPWEK